MITDYLFWGQSTSFGNCEETLVKHSACPSFVKQNPYLLVI